MYKMLKGGGPGEIKGYQYPVTKYELEKAVDSVLKKNVNIRRDTVDNYITEIDSNKNEIRLEDNYYNNGISTLIINIKKDSVVYNYFIRYYGDSASWDTTNEVVLGITYVNGYSEGKNKPSPELKKKFTNIFESEFINKVDQQVGKSHIEPE